MPKKKPPPKSKKPLYDVVWNGERGRYETFVGKAMIGFHPLKGGAEAMGERATKPQPAKPCSICGEPSVAAEELPHDGGIVRFCLKHLRERDPKAAKLYESIKRK